MRPISDLGAAVVGTGFIGVVHVEALRRLGVNVAGVVGFSPERALAKAASYPLPVVYESFEQALEDPAVDVVNVTTPNRLHYRAVASGEPGNDYPTFRDGHWQNVLADAVLRSNRERTWVEVST